MTDGGQWHAVRGNYLFPVRALSRYFRGRMVSGLRAAAQAGLLHRVTRAGELDATLDALMETQWLVYTKNCLDHTSTVIQYLVRYTRRIAITNARLLSIDAHQVTLRYGDHRTGKANRSMTLDGGEFIRRSLRHVLPKGLMRVRHDGFLANRCRRKRLQAIREALVTEDAADTGGLAPGAGGSTKCVRPRCRRRGLQVIGLIPRDPAGKGAPYGTEYGYRR